MVPVNTGNLNIGMKRKHVTLSIRDKVDLLEKLESGFTVQNLCNFYNIGASTVYDIKKQKQKLLNFVAESESENQICMRKKLHAGRSAELDRSLINWLKLSQSQGIELSGDMVKAQARIFHEELKLDYECEYTDGWLQRFKRRHGVKLRLACAPTVHPCSDSEIWQMEIKSDMQADSADNDEKYEAFPFSDMVKANEVDQNSLVNMNENIHSYNPASNTYNRFQIWQASSSAESPSDEDIQVEDECNITSSKYFPQSESNKVKYSRSRDQQRLSTEQIETQHKNKKRKVNTMRKHVALSISEKVDLLQQIDSGVPVKTLCYLYNIGISTIYDIKRKKEQLLKFYTESKSKKQMSKRKSMRNRRCAKIDQVLINWIKLRQNEGLELSGDLLKSQAKIFHEEMGINHKCDYSEGWLQRFKHRHGLKFRSSTSPIMHHDGRIESMSMAVHPNRDILNVDTNPHGLTIEEIKQESEHTVASPEEDYNRTLTEYRQVLSNNPYNKDSDLPTKISVDRLVSLCDELIDGLEQHSFINEQEILNVYILYDKLISHKSKNSLQDRESTTQFQNPVPSSSVFPTSNLC